MLTKSDTFKKCLQDMEAEFTEKSLMVSMAVVRGITEVDAKLPISMEHQDSVPLSVLNDVFFFFNICNRWENKKEEEG